MSTTTETARKPRIYTSYWGNIKKLRAAGIVPIGISVSPPKWALANTIHVKKLAPTYNMLKLQRAEYTPKFHNILAKLDANSIKQELLEIGEGADVAILCYEKPADFCHRHLVATWLNENCEMPTPVTEWTE